MPLRGSPLSVAVGSEGERTQRPGGASSSGALAWAASVHDRGPFFLRKPQVHAERLGHAEGEEQHGREHQDEDGSDLARREQ